jgi:uncharacterized protein DUF4326
MPKRIQRQRTAGWRMPKGAVYVGRPTKYGNPYKWSDYQSTRTAEDGEPIVVSASARRRFAVTDFESVVRFGSGSFDYPAIEEIRRDLAGKDLVCWCPEDGPCHADVLLKLANADPDEIATA